MKKVGGSENVPPDFAEASVADDEAAERDFIDGFADLLARIAPVDLHHHHNLFQNRPFHKPNQKKKRKKKKKEKGSLISDQTQTQQSKKCRSC